MGLPTCISFLQATEVIVVLFSPISGAVDEFELTLHGLPDFIKMELKHFSVVAFEL